MHNRSVAFGLAFIFAFLIFYFHPLHACPFLFSLTEAQFQAHAQYRMLCVMIIFEGTLVLKWQSKCDGLALYCRSCMCDSFCPCKAATAHVA